LQEVWRKHYKAGILGIENLRKAFTILLVFLMGFLGEVRSQVSPPIDSNYLMPEIYNERFLLQTDRNMYASGERILFRAFNISRPEIQKEYWSKVLYFELVRSDGTPVKQAKYPLSQHGAHGYLEIPGDLLTGNYYILTYTKWMRNFSPSDYACNMVRIINPYISMLEGSGQNSESTVGSVETKSEIKLTEKPRHESSESINCKTDKDIYHQREKVTVKINIPDDLLSSLAECCLAVVRPGVTDTISYSGLFPENNSLSDTGRLNFVPEERGMTVTGKVISGIRREPISKASVRLSVLTDNPTFSEYSTGANGKFLFSLDDITGKHDLFITVDHKTEEPLDLFIDNDFSSGRIKFNNLPFILNELQRKDAQEIMFNMQVCKIYDTGIFKNSRQESSSARKISFYGKPSNIIYLDDYIELPTLEEVFIELVPEVYPVVRKKKTQLVIKNEYYSNGSLPFDPLILVDYLPVNDLDKILHIPPSRVQRVEVINDLFLQGEFFYGGIISIFTRENDLGGMALPENSSFISFKNFEEQESIQFPEYSNSNLTYTNLPDYRNCLYWDPDLVFDQSQSTNVQFYTSDSRGEYTICIRGVTLKGEIIKGTCGFKVQ
jgi:hypothetical protein